MRVLLCLSLGFSLVFLLHTAASEDGLKAEVGADARSDIEGSELRAVQLNDGDLENENELNNIEDEEEKEEEESEKIRDVKPLSGETKMKPQESDVTADHQTVADARPRPGPLPRPGRRRRRRRRRHYGRRRRHYGRRRRHYGRRRRHYGRRRRHYGRRRRHYHYGR